MLIEPDSECRKGDIAKETFKYQVCIERSRPKNDITISLWKNWNNNFEIEWYNCKGGTQKEKFENIPLDEAGRKMTGSEEQARSAYEEYCFKNGFSPYPEAEAYYKRKGFLKEPTE